MLNIGNKKYRNIQEQVGYNTECIKELAEAIDGITLEDKLVLIANDSGTFTAEELDILSLPLAFISNGSRVWIKDSESASEFIYKAIDIKADEVGSAYFNVGGSKIVVTRATGAFVISDDIIIVTYSKSQIDTIVASKANASDVYPKTQTYSKTEVDNALGDKANLTGANFSGPITAPSIIQNTTGFVLNSTALQSGCFVSVVQNGNKVTFVFSGTLTVDTGNPNIVLGAFTIPAEVGAKMIPNIESDRILLNDIIVTAGRTSQRYTLGFFITKWYNASVTFYATLLTNPPVAYVNGDYIVRAEATILLSDNLAS